MLMWFILLLSWSIVSRDAQFNSLLVHQVCVLFSSYFHDYFKHPFLNGKWWTFVKFDLLYWTIIASLSCALLSSFLSVFKIGTKHRNNYIKTGIAAGAVNRKSMLNYIFILIKKNNNNFKKLIFNRTF